MSLGPPMPTRPALALPSPALSQAMNSLKLSAGSAFLATIQIGV
jgi:hypothetical protein